MEETAQIESTPEAVQNVPEENKKSGMQFPKVQMPAFKIPKFDKRMVFILAFIFILAFAIRGHQLQYELFFEFDTYWHARMTSYAITGELRPVLALENLGKDSIIDMVYCKPGTNVCSAPPKDPLAYYQLGGARVPAGPMGFWFINAAVYKIFTFGSAYNKEVWILFVKFLPAIYGALTALAMFFLFRRIYRSNKAGYLAGFFTAASSAFVYRTMAGWYEGSSMVFLFMILGFFLFARAANDLELSRKSMLNAVAAGLVLSISPWIGGWFLIIPYVFIAYGIANLLVMWFRGIGTQKIKAFAVLFVITFAIFAGLMVLHIGFGWTSGLPGYIYKAFPSLQPAVAGGGETTGGEVLAATVGEQNTGWQFFGTKYNALIIFPIIALILIPIRIFRKKNDVLSLLMFFWILATFIMAINRVQLTFAFGLAVAAAAAFVCFDLLELVEKRSKAEKLAVAGFVGFMLITAVGSSIYFISDQFPTIELEEGWKTALKWISTNTEKDAKFYNWWDEGHWITFIGERGASTDNRNYDFNGDRDFGLLVTEDDENKIYEIVKSYGSDYVILDEGLLMKQRSLGMYAYVTTNGNDPRLVKFAQRTNNPDRPVIWTTIMSCSVLELTQEINCGDGANIIPLASYLTLPTTWADKTSSLIDGVPVFIYRNEENSRLYILIPATNSGLLARLWFHAPDITHFEEIYSAKGIKIFRVK